MSINTDEREGEPLPVHQVHQNEVKAAEGHVDADDALPDLDVNEPAPDHDPPLVRVGGYMIMNVSRMPQ
jgi:hypothetical protein